MDVPSLDIGAAYAHLCAWTLPRKSAIEEKKAIVNEIRHRQLLSEDVLRRHPTVYIGSATDTEYPLLLGCRKIVMVDPILKGHDAQREVGQRIAQLIREKPRASGNERVFPFDFGHGDEEVTVTMDWRVYYGSERQDTMKQYGRFQPPGEVGLILGYQTAGTDIAEDEVTMSHLVSGGYFLVNHCLQMFLDTVTPEEQQTFLFRGHPGRTGELLCRKYGALGFEFIELECMGDSYHYAFLRKK